MLEQKYITNMRSILYATAENDKENYKVERVIRKRPSYKDKWFYSRCHNFAFKIPPANFNDYDLTNEAIHELSKELKDFKDAQEGDMVLYYSSEINEYIHFAVLNHFDDIENSIVISKWGSMEVFKHKIFNCPYYETTDIKILPKKFIRYVRQYVLRRMDD